MVPLETNCNFWWRLWHCSIHWFSILTGLCVWEEQQVFITRDVEADLGFFLNRGPWRGQNLHRWANYMSNICTIPDSVRCIFIHSFPVSSIALRKATHHWIYLKNCSFPKKLIVIFILIIVSRCRYIIRTGALQGPITFELVPVPFWIHPWICPGAFVNHTPSADFNRNAVHTLTI